MTQGLLIGKLSIGGLGVVAPIAQELPRTHESSNLTRDNLSREIGSARCVPPARHARSRLRLIVIILMILIVIMIMMIVLITLIMMIIILMIMNTIMIILIILIMMIIMNI